MFNNLINSKDRIVDQIDQNVNKILVVGQPRIGKSTLLQNIANHYLNIESYEVLRLKGNSNYAYEYSAIIENISAISNTLGTLNEITNELDNKAINIAKIIAKSYKNIGSSVKSLSDVEIDILNRLMVYSKNKNLIILADDIEFFDSKSVEFLNLLTSSKIVKSFISNKNIFIIATSNKCEFDTILFDSKEQINCLNKFMYERELILQKISIDNSVSDNLYNLTGGNMGLVVDIYNYLEDDNSINLNDATLTTTSSFSSFLNELLDEKINNINLKYEHMVELLKKASISGSTFFIPYLQELSQYDYYEITRILSNSANENLTVHEENFTSVSFSGDFIFNYFLEKIGNEKTEYHFRMANAIKKLRPTDYYSRYKHLLYAARPEEAIDIAMLGCIREKFGNKSYPTELYDFCSKNQDYKILLETIDKVQLHLSNNSNIQQVLNLIDALDIFTSLIQVEIDYVKSFAIYKLGNVEDYNDALMILNEISLREDIEFEQILKSEILLLTLYINRLGSYELAKQLEKKIIKKLSDKIKTNTELIYYVRKLELLAPAMYNMDVSELKLKRSYDYFKENNINFYNEYIHAITNLSATFLVNSKFDEAYKYSNEGVSFVDNSNIFITNIYKLFNNYAISGYFTSKMDLDICINIISDLLKDTNLAKKILLHNNLNVFYAMNGRTENALTGFDDLYMKNKEEQHNDYYDYLINFNFIVLLCLNNKYEDATKYLANFNKIIPAIIINYTSILNQRYKSLEYLVVSKKQFANYNELSQFFRTLFCEDSNTYWSEALILTDTQFWS